MFEGPDISRVAALMGDPARANMLSALIDGRALTAGELARAGGVTRQTASSHLAQLADARLVERAVQGRHHYFRLADDDVLHAIEALMTVAQRRSGRRTRTGPRDAALRRARVCYNHMAGAVAVATFDALVARQWLVHEARGLVVTPVGGDGFAELGIDLATLERRPSLLCRPCLDWSERRPHLGGALGRAILALALGQGWARRVPDSRAIFFPPAGECAFRSAFGMTAMPAEGWELQRSLGAM